METPKFKKFVVHKQKDRFIVEVLFDNGDVYSGSVSGDSIEEVFKYVGRLLDGIAKN